MTPHAQFMPQYITITDDNGRHITIPYLDWIRIVGKWRKFVEGLEE